jgi:hypothetical protein
MMEYGEKHNMLAPEQFGSRKSMSAIEHALNKRLVTDILRQSGTNAIYIANDAKACYDRIILMVAYLTMRNFGIPSMVAKSTISTILGMKHYVRTSYGDSTRYYGGDKWTTLPHGCGQGNGYGPALWACISSPLLHILRQQGFGTKLFQPISNNLIHIAAFAFVDDTDIIQTEDPTNRNKVINHSQEDCLSNLFQTTQKSIDIWSSTLTATGGELEPSKTYCIPIIPQWTGIQRTLPKTISDSLQIHITSTNSSKDTIKQKAPTDALFTLGLWQSPSGKETQQVNHMCKIMEDWNNKTNTRRITWTQARIASNATIGKTLSYPLPATALSEHECRRLQQIFQNAILGKMGVVRTTPSLLATAPSALGGFGILSFEIDQLCAHLGMLLLHGPNMDSITGTLLRSTAEYYAIEAGLPGDPLQMHPVPYATHATWIHQTLTTMAKYNIHIRSNIEQLRAWTTNDQFIMTAVQARLSPHQLGIINKVRLYLRVVTWSDLISANGKTYDKNLIRGVRGTDNPTPSSTKYQWPNVPPPSPIERETWTQIICTTFNISMATPYTNELRDITWTADAFQYAQWRLDPIENHLFQFCGARKWTRWIPTQSHTHYATRLATTPYVVKDLVNEIPLTCDMVSVTQRGPFTYVSCTAHPQVIHYPSITRQSIPVSTQQQSIQFVYNVTLNQGIIFTDGSSQKNKAAYAAVIQPPDWQCPFPDVDFTQMQCISG